MREPFDQKEIEGAARPGLRREPETGPFWLWFVKYGEMAVGIAVLIALAIVTLVHKRKP